MTLIADFGPLVVETDIDDAVLGVLSTWLPTYLSQIERERSLARNYLPRPKAASFANTLEDDEFLDHILPAIIVTTASTDAPPLKDGNGLYYASFSVVVSAIVRGRRPPETRHTAALYGGCIRRALTQQNPAGLSNVLWTSGSVAPVKDTTDQGRYLAASINQFRVDVDDALQANTGPTEPSEDPYADNVPVAIVTIDVETASDLTPDDPVG